MVRFGLAISAALLSAMAGLALWAERAIPADARVALHFGLDGTVNRYGDKGEAVFVLWVMVGVGAFVSVLMAVLAQAEPMRANLMRSKGTYLAAWIGSLVLLVVVTGMMAFDFTRSGPADPDAFVRISLGLSGVLILILGNALGKVRPNFTMGVRTPWTLTSDLAWDKTHRLAGLLMVVWGVAQVGLAAVGSVAWAVGIAVGGALVLVPVVFVASYLYWRADPDRRTRPGAA